MAALAWQEPPELPLAPRLSKGERLREEARP